MACCRGTREFQNCVLLNATKTQEQDYIQMMKSAVEYYKWERKRQGLVRVTVYQINTGMSSRDVILLIAIFLYNSYVLITFLFLA